MISRLKIMNKETLNGCLLTGAVTAAVLIIMHIVTNQIIFNAQPYNSYILQAQSWIDGRLDLGMDYPYLELAIFDGKYFVSFPPFPSYVMLPFVMAGWTSCDGVIAFVCAVTGAVFAYKTAAEFVKNNISAVILSLLVTIGANWLFTSVNAWVWFIAQNMAFTLTMAAIYYAVKGKAAVSLALWGCAVGCRPFQIIYIVIIAFILYRNFKDSGEKNLADILKRHILAIIPVCIIAFSYMALNYARFGNPLEFGHNYLPEFMREKTGQFNISYISDNFIKLFRLPEWDGEKIVFQNSEGFCIFIASPVFAAYLIYTIKGVFKGDKSDRINLGIIFILIAIHIFAIILHKTMGGSHYGNRYTNDILPAVLVAVSYSIGKFGDFKIINAMLLILGAVLNIMWVVMYY